MEPEQPTSGSAAERGWTSRALDRQVARYRRAPWSAGVSVILNLAILWLIWRPEMVSPLARLAGTALGVVMTAFVVAWQMSRSRTT